MRKTKAQQAIESMMIYVYSTIAIVSVVGVLFYFGAFDNQTTIKEGCESGAQIACKDAIIKNDGIIEIQTTNKLTKAITITKMTATINAKNYTRESINIPIKPLTDATISIETGQTLKTGDKEQVTYTYEYTIDGSSNTYTVNGNAVSEVYDENLGAEATGGCGDGIVQAGEQCDNGTSNNGALCTPSENNGCYWCDTNCKEQYILPPFCGNAEVEIGEDCDEGFLLNNIPCTAGYGETCIYCTNECKNETITGPHCGDETLQQSSEVCDGAMVGGWSCENEGLTSGTLGCAENCQEYDTSNCIQCSEEYYDSNNWAGDYTGDCCDPEKNRYSIQKIFMEGVNAGTASKACCTNPNACVANGECFEPGVEYDANADGNTDVCSSASTWIDCTEESHCDNNDQCETTTNICKLNPCGNGAVGGNEECDSTSPDPLLTQCVDLDISKYDGVLGYTGGLLGECYPYACVYDNSDCCTERYSSAGWPGDFTEETCCGDQLGEYYSNTYYAIGVNTDQEYVEACCSKSTSCLGNNGCVLSGESEDVDGDADKEICDSGTWYNCHQYYGYDENNGYCSDEEVCIGIECEPICNNNDICEISTRGENGLNCPADCPAFQDEFNDLNKWLIAGTGYDATPKIVLGQVEFASIQSYNRPAIRMKEPLSISDQASLQIEARTKTDFTHVTTTFTIQIVFIDTNNELIAPKQDITITRSEYVETFSETITVPAGATSAQVVILLDTDSNFNPQKGYVDSIKLFQTAQ